MPQLKPRIVWFRQDLRLTDNPALAEAVETGAPIIPLYILDDGHGQRPMGAASRWWLDKSLRALGADLRARGLCLILRRGQAGAVLDALIDQTGADGVHWNRLYDPAATTRDAAIKEALKGRGLTARSSNAALLAEPWEIVNGSGQPYKVFTPFWRTLKAHVDASHVEPAPTALKIPDTWPASDALDDWGLHPKKPDWSGGFGGWTPGEAGAQAALADFLAQRVNSYAQDRDIPAKAATSRLSPHLHFGEIGPRQIWVAAKQAAASGDASAEQVDKFLSELAWRDFNHHTLYARPDLPQRPFKPAYDALPWRDDPKGLQAWRRGRTGYPFVDAGMRELWTTGYMENRVRMVVASFLVKHLLLDWRLGEAWFWDTLLDADIANNVGNWQWVAGCGADAAPFFRIFNPIAQGEKFDADGRYIRRWVPELARLPDKHLHRPWEAPADLLRACGVTLGATYPKPIVEHDLARKRALEAFKAVRDADDA